MQDMNWPRREVLDDKGKVVRVDKKDKINPDWVQARKRVHFRIPVHLRCDLTKDLGEKEDDGVKMYLLDTSPTARRFRVCT